MIGDSLLSSGKELTGLAQTLGGLAQPFLQIADAPRHRRQLTLMPPNRVLEVAQQPMPLFTGGFSNQDLLAMSSQLVLAQPR